MRTVLIIGLLLVGAFGAYALVYAVKSCGIVAEACKHDERGGDEDD